LKSAPKAAKPRLQVDEENSRLKDALENCRVNERLYCGEQHCRAEQQSRF